MVKPSQQTNPISWTEDELRLMNMAVCFVTHKQAKWCESVGNKEYKKQDGTDFTDEEVHQFHVTFHKYDNLAKKLGQALEHKEKENAGRLDTVDTLTCGASETKREE